MGKIIVDNIQTQNVVMTSISTPVTPTTGQLYYDSTTGNLRIYDGLKFYDIYHDKGISGGDIMVRTINGTVYRIHTFCHGGTFYTPRNITIDYLLIGGGGSGGGNLGGGGGAGGYVYNTSVSLSSGAYPVGIGLGGRSVRGTQDGGFGNPGEDSNFNGVTAFGGSPGIGGDDTRSADIHALDPTRRSFGSGGGGSGYGTSGRGTSSSQGNDGGQGGGGSNNYPGGGGGGAGAVGETPSSGSSVGGTGGAGLQNNIDGNNYYYAGGGGGGAYTNYRAGHGGIGGGGGGGSHYTTSSGGDGGGSARNSGQNGMGVPESGNNAYGMGGNGGANTGSGGGGGSHAIGSNYSPTTDLQDHFPWSGSGGSGICIIRYAL